MVLEVSGYKYYVRSQGNKEAKRWLLPEDNPWLTSKRGTFFLLYRHGRPFKLLVVAAAVKLNFGFVIGRFSLLLLDPGEIYFEDFSVFYYPYDSSLQDAFEQYGRGSFVFHGHAIFSW